MGLTIETLESKRTVNAENGYKLEEELYSTADGRIVRGGTGEAHTLYKRRGAFISYEEAVALELITAEEAADRIVASPASAPGAPPADPGALIKAATDEGLVEILADTIIELKGRDLDLDDDERWTAVLGEDRIASVGEFFATEVEIEAPAAEAGKASDADSSDGGGEKQADAAEDKKADQAKDKQRPASRNKKG